MKRIRKTIVLNSTLEMKLKNKYISDKIGRFVSLNLMLEEDMNTLHSISGKEILNIDESIHNLRKSLKSISAILFLYEFQIGQKQYLQWKSGLKSLSKQFAQAREDFAYLQTFKKIEDKLKDIDKSDLLELRNHFESKYNLIVQENIVRKEAIQKGNEAILKVLEEMQNSHINSELKLLKRRHLESLKKTQKLFKRLSLKSSSEEFHQFRKYCKRFYLQQLVFNRLGLKKTYKQNKKLDQLTEYLGKEHDLHLFNQYLSVHFADLLPLLRLHFMLKIRKLKKNTLMLYPKINY
ncbi:MAG TPA: hypothetical protein DCL77_07620 [Prolixibacteraceae bacterium]|jgi:CHAD domain-containing protein|nr:hypothetical protein [Prolixibacteraceae bacterium]